MGSFLWHSANPQCRQIFEQLCTTDCVYDLKLAVFTRLIQQNLFASVATLRFFFFFLPFPPSSAKKYSDITLTSHIIENCRVFFQNSPVQPIFEIITFLFSLLFTESFVLVYF